MPNWAKNQLTITGPSDALDDFQQKAKGQVPLSADQTEDSDLCFHNFVPVDRETESQVKAWGTKWEADGVNADRPNSTTLSYSFLTAWSPPEHFVRRVSADYPTLTFELWSADPAMDWHYYLSVKAGETISEQQTTYDEEAADFWGDEQIEEVGSNGEATNP